MSNTLNTPTLILRKMLSALVNNLGFASHVDRQIDKSNVYAAKKAGDTVQVEVPGKYIPKAGPGVQVQDTNSSLVPVTVDQHYHIAWNFTLAELTHSVDSFMHLHGEPAMAALASQIDSAIADKYKSVYNLTGTPGTTPATSLPFTQAHAKLDWNSCPRKPMDKRTATVNPDANAAMINGGANIFSVAKDLPGQYRSGLLLPALGGVFDMSQNVASHTVGAYAGTPKVDGASQTGATLVTDGWSSGASTLNEGDVFTIDGVYSVNPVSKRSTGSLQQFVVTATISDTSGAKSIAISPSIITSGNTQTVDSSPADNADINVVGTASTAFPQNMLFHESAFTLAMAKFDLPQKAEFAVQESFQGINISFVRDYNNDTHSMTTRLDVLYGVAALRPEWACRIIG